MLRSAICLASFMMMSAPVAADVGGVEPPFVVSCGHLIGSIVKVVGHITDPIETTIDYEPLMHANALVRVPAKTTRCVKVRFLGFGRCLADYCSIAATIDGRPMPTGRPSSQGAEEMPYGDGVHDFAQRVGAGLHKVEIKIEVVDDYYPPDPEEIDRLYLRSWVLDVSTYK